MDLEDLLDTLLPRERYILRMRYGLDDNNFKSLRTISEVRPPWGFCPGILRKKFHTPT